MLEKEKAVHLTDDSFNAEVINSDKPTLVDFWAPWCGPCKMVGPIVEELAEEYDGKVNICKLNVDENPKTPAQYSVRSIPTLIMFKAGKSTDQVVGAVPKAKIEELIKKAL
ncbi:MAG: thioredoxin [Deltaproteobacteria bacterium CG12_big_fil_rev_8_21_14_0_65_43_10]|nr:MAG: thioredoxin [Deltaproteobacteria bacterium CG2_30_43_15]PIQ44405.1 MAG: thioredoxin [Deltaproteobacteria bacterium CG12_big_fil_rev_8_21_14_0_65_43_10]PIU86278.1 MAG: thioredoxin [Deltaproteobacteria bacterium CG06_land_8_20_14_3_00_44_19]PIX26443.1 MAG: thioredoxin [Deltaproteobacteria bacterium CG_4_8_14_3_um_filter_43_13]PIZ18663.1 MAG: thioredoxin [Deltaproteobacteria bacterium CG_4_10_14_0_8_um_filter_43_12]PJB40157.1 MAG: thioredoxin [Deltaproteobacteria bacterium CG_4_9_14_3_um_